MKKTAFFIVSLGLAAGAQAACYTVLNAKGQIISESPNPPVDMSYQLHQTVPYKYGQGATLVFGSADPDCGQEVDTYSELHARQGVSADGRALRRSQRAARRDRQ
ncbi:MAG: hypothetical protein Q4F13_04650 [Pseudomonadota bacterium]|nr:hypothetical protein [Pseudomonadota bacterium]